MAHFEAVLFWNGFRTGFFLVGHEVVPTVSRAHTHAHAAAQQRWCGVGGGAG
jgi:hypothetical protein